ncbi:hypothetical protein [Paracnuella aquatica]|uniref:hypothetical protein n=1 Tax=Paracnuella aquatica TaxID=2268757 RepID=UPI000F511271|nr:hypothetical protein [Paracnuella aquatica]RPD49078.1 hypothetical protein DRJ53_08150 [Paracnuella aquatica]
MKRIALSILTSALLMFCAHTSLAQQAPVKKVSASLPLTSDASTVASSYFDAAQTDALAQAWPWPRKRYLL